MENMHISSQQYKQGNIPISSALIYTSRYRMTSIHVASVALQCLSTSEFSDFSQYTSKLSYSAADTIITI